jgi:hypothetical protein
MVNAAAVEAPPEPLLAIVSEAASSRALALPGLGLGRLPAGGCPPAGMDVPLDSRNDREAIPASYVSISSSCAA